MAQSVVVLGAGVSGLSTAWKLSEAGLAVDVIEKRDHLGGTAASFTHSGPAGDFKVDLGPHKIYTQMPHIMQEIKDLMGEELQTLPKQSRIRILGKYFKYPFKPVALMTGVSPLQSMGFGFSYAAAMAKGVVSKKEDYSYEKYLTNRFGKSIYQAVFEGYAEKVWGCDPNSLDGELARIRVAIPSLFELVKRMVVKNKHQKEITASEFYYPKNGCIELSNHMGTRVTNNGGQIHLKSWPTEIKVDGNHVTEVTYESNGEKKTISPNFLVSTIHLGQIVKLFNPLPPKEVLDAASQLRYRGLIILYLVVKKPRLFDDNWIFYPEKDIIFNRISEQKGFSNYMGPADKTVLMVEITCTTSAEKLKGADRSTSSSDKEDFTKIDNSSTPNANAPAGSSRSNALSPEQSELEASAISDSASQSDSTHSSNASASTSDASHTTQTKLDNDSVFETGDANWNSTDAQLFERAVADLEKVGILKKEDVEEYFTLRLRNKYPLYTIGFQKHLDTVANYLENFDNLLTIGRQGLFNYNNMDHCLDMGFLAAQHILNNKSREDWQETKKKFLTYQIVD